jgi:hypothetical protein
VHALRRDTARDEIFANGLGAAGAERDVVFARAAFVGMTFSGESVAVIPVKPLRLFIKRFSTLRRKFRGVGFEEHAVSHIDNKVLLAPRRSTPNQGAGLVVLLFRAAPNGESAHDDGCEFGMVDDAGHVHCRASIFPS